MAPRALGALFALVAALLFMASLAGAVVPKDVPGWFDGHPTVGSKTLERKAIHVGLLGAYGCNLGEKIECQSLDAGSMLQPVGIAELAALGLVTLTTILLLVSIWTIGDRRKSLGRIVLIETVIAVAIAAGWFVIGPNITAGNATVAVPIGIGIYAFGGGAIAALIAGILARFVEREPLRLKTSRMPAMTAQPAFDVRELVRPNAMTAPPAQIPYTPVASPGGALPGPAGPLGPPAGSGPHAPLATPHPGTGPHAPLFENAPQLRPLYDIANVGVIPAPVPPTLPARPPTPIPRASFAETSEFQRNATPPPPPPAPQPPPEPQVRAKTAPRSSAPKISTAPAAPPARTKAASLPPRAVSTPSRPGGGGVATPERPISKQPTIAHAIPPMPAMGAPPPLARSTTDAEPSTAVEIDAEAKAKYKAAQTRTTAMQAAEPEAPVSAERAADTAETPVAEPPSDEAVTRAAPRVTPEDLEPTARGLPSNMPAPVPAAFPSNMPGAFPSNMPGAFPSNLPAGPPAAGPPPPAATPAVTVDKADFDKTLERNPPAKPIGLAGLKPQAIAVPKIIVPKPAPKPEATPDPDVKHETKVPISTAPASLPPPKKAQPATSGPTPACPQCEAPMAWVEEHLRFYCAQCRMYF